MKQISSSVTIATARRQFGQAYRPHHRDAPWTFGVVMKLIDDAAAGAAGRHAGTTAVTVSVEKMSFLSLVYAGGLLNVRAHLA